MTVGVGCAAYLSCTEAARARRVSASRPGARAPAGRSARGRARTVLGIVFVVGAMAELSELRQAGAEQAALLGEPHRELGAARHRRARVHQRAHGRQEQLCAHRGAPESRGAACARRRAAQRPAHPRSLACSWRCRYRTGPARAGRAGVSGARRSCSGARGRGAGAGARVLVAAKGVRVAVVRHHGAVVLPARACSGRRRGVSARAARRQQLRAWPGDPAARLTRRPCRPGPAPPSARCAASDRRGPAARAAGRAATS